MKPLITIIIPVYNVENYITRCIESVINQTYKNLEVILVNDESPDSSLMICKEFEQIDNRIKILNKKNGGQGSARNVALDIAKGDYIAFVDGDDYIDINMIQSLYDALIESGADMSVCGCYSVHELKTVIDYCPSNKVVYNTEEALKSYFSEPFINSVCWNKLYSKHLFKNIRFPEIRAREDSAIAYKLIAQCKKIVHIAKPKYYYIIRSGSTERSSFKIDMFQTIRNADDQKRFISNNYPSIYEFVRNRPVEKRIIMLRRMIINNATVDYKDYYNKLLEELKNSLDSDINVELKQKVKRILKLLWLYKIHLNMRHSIRTLAKRILISVKKRLVRV